MKPIKQTNKQTKKTPMHSTTHYSHLSPETVELSAEQKEQGEKRDAKRGRKTVCSLERAARIVELEERVKQIRKGFSFIVLAH